jgi:hypothetical protein
MKPISSLLVAAALGASALAISPISASAEIVCTGNVCWHTHDRYDYPPEANVVVHPMTGVGVLTSTSAGANMKAAAIGAVIVGWNTKLSHCSGVGRHADAGCQQVFCKSLL